MLIFRALAVGILLTASGQAAWAKNTAVAQKSLPPHPVVLELFTSQGCSDCPAADKLVTELAHRPDVIALSLPITYWDILGWKDTFATEANTRRQKSYARIMNRSGVYTPQMIIDGQLDVVGNQRDRVMQAVTMRSSAAEHGATVPVVLHRTGNRIEIAIAKSKHAPKSAATIWVMRTLGQGSVDIGDGENRNRFLTYTNVVRDLQRAGEWKGQAMKIDVPANLTKLQYDGVVVVLQAQDFGPVLGAAAMSLSDVRAVKAVAKP